MLQRFGCISFLLFKLLSINWSNFIVWLPLLLEILSNVCVAIVCFPGCRVINLKINLIFLINLFFWCPDNCPRGKLAPVRVTVWFRVSVKIRVAKKFSPGVIVLEPVFLLDQKIKTKTGISWERKELLR